MAPDRSSLAERLRRSRARVVGRVAAPEPAAEAPLPEAIADPASAGIPEEPRGSDKTARLARARELIRRTERGWKELRVGSADDGRPPLRNVQPGAAPEVHDGGADPTPEARPADEPFSREDHDFPLASRYGGADLVRLLEVSEEAAARLQIRAEEPGVDLSRALFLDTETSGLAGGTGTFAFLIGVGFVEEERFRVTQFLMRSPLGEAAMLEELAVLAAGRRDLVTYNGGSFDLPLLDTRFALNGVPSPFRDGAPSGSAASGAPAVQAPPRERPPFHPGTGTPRGRARRRHPGRPDPPGVLRLPPLRTPPRHGIGAGAQPLRHRHAGRARAPGARAPGRGLAQRRSRGPSRRGTPLLAPGESEVAIPLLERALSAGLSGRNRDRCLLDLGERRKQLGDWPGAIELWRQVSIVDSRERLDVLVWLAKHEEHQRKEPARALTHVEDALERLPGSRWDGRRAAATGRNSNGAPPGCRRAWTDPGRRIGLERRVQPAPPAAGGRIARRSPPSRRAPRLHKGPGVEKTGLARCE